VVYVPLTHASRGIVEMVADIAPIGVAGVTTRRLSFERRNETGEFDHDEFRRQAKRFCHDRVRCSGPGRIVQKTWLAYNDPHRLAERHGAGTGAARIVDVMAEALAAVATTATTST
jgi:hypothetical protein